MSGMVAINAKLKRRLTKLEHLLNSVVELRRQQQLQQQGQYDTREARVA